MGLILVVDDEGDIRELIKTTLELAGHEVVIASGGEEAINKIRRRPFDAVLLDIMMPELSGYEVLEQIRSIPSRAETPVIVVTAKHDPAGVQREMNFGALDHIVKPFLPSELEDVVERALAGETESHEERRRILGTDAEIYGSMQSLVDSAREDDTQKHRR